MRSCSDKRLLKRARRMGVILELMAREAEGSPELKSLVSSDQWKQQLERLETLPPGPLGELLGLLEAGVPEHLRHLV